MAGIGILGVLGDFGGEDEELHKKSQSEGTSLRQTASFEPSTVKIGPSVWSVRETKKILKKVKKRHKNGIFHDIVGRPPFIYQDGT